jgi:hypothetical protein
MKLFRPTDEASAPPVVWYSEQVREMLASQADPLRALAIALELMLRAGQEQKRPAHITLSDLSCKLLVSVEKRGQEELHLDYGEWDRQTLVVTRRQAIDVSVRSEGVLLHRRGATGIRVTFPSPARRAAFQHQVERRDARRSTKPGEQSPTAVVFRHLQNWLVSAHAANGSVLACTQQPDARPLRVVRVQPDLGEGTLTVVVMSKGGHTERLVLPQDALIHARLDDRHAAFHAGLTVPLHVFVRRGEGVGSGGGSQTEAADLG